MRKLLKQGKAVIHRKYPMVIRLKYLVDDSKNYYDYDLRFDPGSKITGVAIVKNKHQAIGLMELKHKQGISEALEKRSSLRRGRRGRKTQYRRCKWKKAIRLYQRYKALKKQCKDTLKDAAVVNTTRWKLFETLKTFNLPLHVQSGAKTKMQRIQNSFKKEHYFDALCIGDITKPLKIK